MSFKFKMLNFIKFAIDGECALASHEVECFGNFRPLGKEVLLIDTR